MTQTKKTHREREAQGMLEAVMVIVMVITFCAAAPAPAADGERATIGFVTGHGELSIDGQLSRAVERLQHDFDVVEVRLDSPDALDGLDAVVIAGAADTPDAELYVLDQYLMSGGRAAFLIGAAVFPESGDRPDVSDANVFGFVKAYGIRVNADLLLDTACAPEAAWGPIATSAPYACWPVVTEDRLSDTNPIVYGLRQLTFPWTSSITLTRRSIESGTWDVLARSSPESWTVMAFSEVAPVPALEPPSPGMEKVGSAGERGFVMAVAVEGVLRSAFAGKQVIVEDDTGPHFVDPVGIVETSGPLRLVVVGNSMMFRDDLADQLPDGAEFLDRIVRWLTDDVDVRAARAPVYGTRSANTGTARRLGLALLAVVAVVVVVVAARAIAARRTA